MDKRTIETQEKVCPTLDSRDCYWDTVINTETLGTTPYTYDAARNRTDKAAVLQTGNRLVSFDGWSLVYDQDGNLTQKSKSGVGSYQYEWNSLGQLTKVTANGQVVTYQYDGMGRWARRGTIDYIYDNQHLFMEVVGSTLLREYAYREGVDQPHMVRNFEGEAGGIYYYVTESPGHVTALVNTSNQVVNKYRYDPWGAEQHCTEAKPNPLRFAGRHYDATGRIYQMRARWYDPQTGRFLSEDPIGLAGGINPYAYVSNDPANARDPSGLCKIEWRLNTDECAANNECPALVGSWNCSSGGGMYSGAYNWTPGQRGPAIPGAGPDGPAWSHVGPGGPGGLGGPPSSTIDAGCVAHAAGELAVRLLLDAGLFYGYSTGAGLLARGALTYASGWATSNGIILRATVNSLGPTGAWEMWAGARTMSTGGALLGAQAGIVSAGTAPGISIIPGGNTLNFYRNGHFGRCRR